MTEKRSNKKYNSVERQRITKDRLSEVFPALIAFLLPFLIILVVFSMKNDTGVLFIILTILSIGIGVGTFLNLTKKHRLDLLEGVAYRIPKEVQEIIHDQKRPQQTSSLALALASLFKQFNELADYYYLKVENRKYQITEEEYRTLKGISRVYIVRAKHTDLYLGFEIISE
ncbi:MAG: hypothetical protein ABFS32_20620 [Bacteroidota bacterium]